MRKVSNLPDTRAEQICFGVEIETAIPSTAQVGIGGYHSGLDVVRGLTPSRIGRPATVIMAPSFEGHYWNAQRDGSIQPPPGHLACEFVSPILRGQAGLRALADMLHFIRSIGGKVNASCGLHITIGIQSVMGGDPSLAERGAFLKKLGFLVNHHTWAIYAQTGVGRHQNTYCSRLGFQAADALRNLPTAGEQHAFNQSACQVGRGILNLLKAHNPGSRGCIEFRAFAATLDTDAVLHHLATCFGLVRRAMTVECDMGFAKPSKKCKAATAPQALARLHRVLGWKDSVPNRPVALGLFGDLHDLFYSYSKRAVALAQQFESSFPAANL